MTRKLSLQGLVTAACLVVAAVPLDASDWTVPGDFATIQEAVDSVAVVAGDRIVVGPGQHSGANVIKAVEIVGTDGAQIVTGPLHGSGHPYGFLIGGSGDGAGGDGVSISHFTFAETVAFPVYSRGASYVTVSHNRFFNSLQGVTNWGGDGWDVSRNAFVDLRTSNGGGIAIVMGDFNGREVVDNLIAHNRISGVLHVASIDLGGYEGSGIVLYADFRDGRAGASGVAYNRVTKNHVSLVSDTPGLVDVNAFELTDTRVAPDTNIIHGNAIGFNDFRGTADQILLTPSNLDTSNTISRNLGENRASGVHPRAFH